MKFLSLFPSLNQRLIRPTKMLSTKLVKRILFRITRALVLVYLGLTAVLYFDQTDRLFLASTTPATHVYNYNAEERFLEVEGARLHGLLFKKDAPQGVILFFHANAGSLEDWGQVCENLVSYNLDCLMFDYRGYGKSSGSIKNQPQWLADGEAMYDYAKAEYPDLPIILYGRSVGTSLATHLAGQKKVAGVILETPPYAFTEVAQTHFPFLPVRWLLKFPLPNADYLATNQNPTLLLHGTADKIIPYSQFEKLKARFPEYESVSIEGGGHNNLGQYDQYWDGVKNFLENL